MPNEFQKINAQLVEICRLQALGDDLSARHLADELIADEQFISIVLASKKRLEGRHRMSVDDGAIISCVYCWLTDNTLLQANSENLLSFLSNRITYNGSRAGTKDIAREYGLHDTWIYNKQIPYSESDGSFNDLTDVIASDYDIFHEIDAANANGYSKVIVKTIDSAVCDYLLKNGVEIADFIEYCTDWCYDHTVKSKDYGTASTVWNWLSKPKIRGSLNNRLNRAFDKVETTGIDCSAVREALSDWKRTRTIITLSVAMADQNL